MLYVRDVLAVVPVRAAAPLPARSHLPHSPLMPGIHARILVISIVLYAVTGELAFRTDQVVLVPGRGCELAAAFDFHLLFVWSSLVLLVTTPAVLTVVGRGSSLFRTALYAGIAGGIGSGLSDAVYRYRLTSNPDCPGFQLCVASEGCLAPPGSLDHLISILTWGVIAGLVALPVSFIVRLAMRRYRNHPDPLDEFARR